MTIRGVPVLLAVIVTVNCAIALDCRGENCKLLTQNDSDNFPFQITTHVSKPVDRPKAMNMVHEDEMLFRPTMSSAATDEPKARSLNFTIDEHSQGNKLSTNSATSNGTKKTVVDLSDVDMDSDDMDEGEMELHVEPLNNTPKVFGRNASLGICEKGGLTYDNGEQLEVGCDSICTCRNGKMDCLERCPHPYFRRGKKVDDPLCAEKPVDDHCCAIMTCADTATEPIEICSYKNKTYHRGEILKNDCSEICRCETGGRMSCKSRCSPIKKTSDRCVEIQDPKDSCCKTILCDVTLEEQPDKTTETQKHRILSAKMINQTSIKIEFDNKLDSNDERPLIDVSSDKVNWTTYTLLPGDFLAGLEKPVKYLRIENDDIVTRIQDKHNKSDQQTHGLQSCTYKGSNYELNEEFNDGCDLFCVCKESGVMCLKFDCPTYSGLDVVDPTCVQWEPDPPDFVAIPPKCCPSKVRCKDNGSCHYENETYPNWQIIPSNVTGCSKKCYCEMGNVECENVCPPVPASPPISLPCKLPQASLGHLPGDDCCMYWTCDNQIEQGNEFAESFPNVNGFQQQGQDEVVVNTLKAIDAHTVKLAFSIPSVIVGLHGRVEVRYSPNNDADLNSWKSEVFAPPDDFLATPQLEFDLPGLMADTEYRIKVMVTLRDVHNMPMSKIYTVRTMRDTATSTLPPMIPIEPDLAITDINATWATVSWRKFTKQEQQFIDGVQLQYKEIDSKVYTATPYIHRAVTSYTLENLKSNMKYEVGIYFIPFAEQPTELRAEHMIHFTTANEVNDYGFNVSLDINLIKATSVEISWSGVPYPEDKYVNIYRAIYQSDSGKGDYSTFKMAKRDAPSKTVIMDLKPGTRYRLWLEVYLTNGRIMTSNVQDFITKPRAAPILGASSHDKLSGDLLDERGDYYGPLVIVAILATIAILSTLVLLLILVKRHGQNKASITPPPRVSQAAYDNPTYKVEIQQETMDL